MACAEYSFHVPSLEELAGGKYKTNSEAFWLYELCNSNFNTELIFLFSTILIEKVQNFAPSKKTKLTI